jgi:hypothetical protein
MAIKVSIRQNTLMPVLIEQTKGAIQRCYAPSSQFRDAAAILDGASKIHIGVNVENVSCGMTQSAERNAIFPVISKGAKLITAIVICTPTETPTPPLWRLPPSCKRIRFQCHGTFCVRFRKSNRINHLPLNSLNQEQHLS